MRSYTSWEVLEMVWTVCTLVRRSDFCRISWSSVRDFTSMTSLRGLRYLSLRFSLLRSLLLLFDFFTFWRGVLLWLNIKCFLLTQLLRIWCHWSLSASGLSCKNCLPHRWWSLRDWIIIWLWLQLSHRSVLSFQGLLCFVLRTRIWYFCMIWRALHLILDFEGLSHLILIDVSISLCWKFWKLVF